LATENENLQIFQIILVIVYFQNLTKRRNDLINRTYHGFSSEFSLFSNEARKYIKL